MPSTAFDMRTIAIVSAWLLSCSLAAQPPVAPMQEDLDAPPVVSAKAWAIADGKTGKILWSRNADSNLQMASTTKIMTAWIVLSLAKDNPNVLKEVATVSLRADKTGGSTAGIIAGEKFVVGDLLYGLLLPSGNDAAVALAEHFGNRLPAAKKVRGDALLKFTAEMNARAKSLGMTKTNYFDPHGNSRNSSSPRDLLKLAWTAMQNPTFRSYVRTREYKGTGVSVRGRRPAVWKNTNQLLGLNMGYNGVKTGTTRGAGACLVSSGHRGKDHLMMVVLGSSSRIGRYVDSRNLYRWAWRMRAKKK